MIRNIVIMIFFMFECDLGSIIPIKALLISVQYIYLIIMSISF
jgi:hypothetical protein